MRLAWILVAGCWSGGAPPANTPPTTQGGALLEGRLQIQPAGMCGGARVPDNYQPPPMRPAAGIQLTVVAGEKYNDGPRAATMTTAADGTFSVSLPPGRYCITLPRGAKPTTAGQYMDLQCLVTTWETCDAIAVVPMKSPISIDHQEPCLWSVCYNGPPPP